MSTYHPDWSDDDGDKTTLARSISGLKDAGLKLAKSSPNLPTKASQSDAKASVDVLQPHKFVKKTYFFPTFCDVCEGVHIGSAYKCTACGMRCHIGYGSGMSEDCYAEALLSHCDRQTSSHVHGTYRVGDITKQKVRDMKSRARTTIKHVFREEQLQEFGKMKKLQDAVEKAGKMIGSEANVHRLLLRGQLISVSALVVVTSLVLYCCKGFGRKAFSICIMQAASNAVWLLSAEAAIAGLVWLLSAKLTEYSVIIHNFASEFGGIQLEDIPINVVKLAAAAQRIAERSLRVTMLLLFVAFAVWVQAIYSM